MKIFFCFLGEVHTQFTSEIHNLINCNDMESAITKINDIYVILRENRRQALLQGIAAGSIFYKVKNNLKKKEFPIFVLKTKFSLSWGYFLIKLYKLSQYPGLQQCCMSLYEFQKNIKIISKNIHKQPYCILWKNLV